MGRKFSITATVFGVILALGMMGCGKSEEASTSAAAPAAPAAPAATGTTSAVPVAAGEAPKMESNTATPQLPTFKKNRNAYPSK